MDGHYLCLTQKRVYELLGHILGFYNFHTIRINFFFSNYLEKSVKKIPVTELYYISLVSL